MDYLPTFPIHITPLMTFGILLIMGAVGGFIAHRLSWLPSITGFMLVGFIMGPSGLSLLSTESVLAAKPFIDVGLALILYRLGLSLNLKTITQSPTLILTSCLESSLTFVLVAGILIFFHIPIAISALVAAVVISSSPAVLLHVAHEVKAQGPVTENTKSLVAMNNIIAFLLFSLALSSVHYTAGAQISTMILQPAYQLSGSLFMGVLLGFILHTLTVRTWQSPQYHLAMVIGILVISVALTQTLHLSNLFTALVIGVFIRTIEGKNPISQLNFGQAFELFFILLFVYAGASLHIHELLTYAPAVFALVIVRSIAKLLGPLIMTRFGGGSLRSAISSGLLMWPMAGLAIGLSYASGNLFPEYAATISAIILGAVTVFETLGPPIAAFAFRYAGEANT